jgi:DUF971 family protein
LVLGTALSAPAQRKLRLNLEKGDRFHVVSKQNMNQVNKVRGQQMETKVDNLTEYDVTVQEVKSDGTYVVQMKYTRMKMNVNNMMVSMAADTKDGSGDEMVSQYLNEMIGKTVTLHMNELGEVQQVKGMEENQQAAAENLSGRKGAQVRQAMSGNMSAEAMRSMMEQRMGTFPEKAVAAGDTWQKSGQTNTVAETDITRKYTYKGRENGQDIIAVETTMAIDNADMQQGQSGQSTKMDLKGTGSGTLKLAPDTGWLIASEMTQEMKGDIKIQRRGGQQMTMPTEIQTDVKMTAQQL